MTDRIPGLAGAAGSTRAAGWRRLIKLVELVVFPSFCRLCGALLDAPGETVVCRACLDALPLVTISACPGCGRFYPPGVEPHPCARCLDSDSPLTRHRSAGAYDGRLKDLVLLCKFRGQSVLGGRLAGTILRALEGDGIWSGVDVLVPVPLHPRRRRERGYNQAEAIARGLSRRLGAAVLTRCLVRVRNIPPQSSLGAAAREGNVKGAFAVRQSDRVRGLVVLLVDDVYTTGATLRACAAVLRKAGAAEVRAVTVARA